MSQADLMILTTTFEDLDRAQEVAEMMVDGGLAVCAQISGAMESIYRWQGKLCREAEYRVTFKVLGERFDLFCGELRQNHPYDAPQMIAWPASYVDQPYLDWAKGHGPEKGNP